MSAATHDFRPEAAMAAERMVSGYEGAYSTPIDEPFRSQVVEAMTAAFLSVPSEVIELVNQAPAGTQRRAGAGSTTSPDALSALLFGEVVSGIRARWPQSDSAATDGRWRGEMKRIVTDYGSVDGIVHGANGNEWAPQDDQGQRAWSEIDDIMRSVVLNGHAAITLTPGVVIYEFRTRTGILRWADQVPGGTAAPGIGGGNVLRWLSNQMVGDRELSPGA